MTHIIVSHGTYGCDTGCCGHVIEVDGKQVGAFQFDHPYDVYKYQGSERNAYLRSWAEDLIREELGEEHVKDLNWEDCVIVND